MNVETLGSRVIQTQVFFHFANSANGALQDTLDKDTLLRVDHLVVATLELAVDVDVFDVQACEVLENFIVWPVFNVLELRFKFGGHLLAFHYLPQVSRRGHVRL
jgi:hypothetical protein